MSFETITVETNGSVAVIGLNRPSSMNAVCAAMLYDLAEAFEQLDKDDSVRAIVLKGGASFFAAGTDMSEFSKKESSELVKEGLYGQSAERISACRKPVIAAVCGYAFGGGLELVLMSDIVIAADNARFGFPEMTLGVLPQMGGVSMLSRRVGRARAADMILTGRHISADEALACGLISRIADSAEVVHEALLVAERIASMPAAGVSLAKHAIAEAEKGKTDGFSEETLARLSLMSADAREGLSALTEKRAPRFEHK